MDAVFFASKRAHYAGVAFARPLLREFGLTPARFDVLSAIEGLPQRTQKALREMLGVARATLSEMLMPLERAGLVRRAPCRSDMRTKLVALTALGRAVLERVRAKWIDSGEVSRLVDFCLTGPLWWSDGFLLRRQLIELTGALTDWFGRGSVPPSYELRRQELARALASFEDEPEIPFVDET